MEKMKDLSYIYIDESGDLGIHGSRYFTIIAVLTNQPIALARIIKKLRQRKLKKKIKKLAEIKANNSNRTIREFVIKKVNNLDCKIFAVVVDKTKILPHLYEVKDKLYNYLCGILIKNIEYSKYKIVITIDKKDTNSLIREDFNRYIKTKVVQKNPDLKVEIYHKQSNSSNELQVVDFIAWSINRKFSFNDDYYYKIIENKIVNKNNMLLWE